MASLKPPKGFFGQNVPHEKDTGALINPMDDLGQEDDGLLQMWIALHANEERSKI